MVGSLEKSKLLTIFIVGITFTLALIAVLVQQWVIALVLSFVCGTSICLAISKTAWFGQIFDWLIPEDEQRSRRRIVIMGIFALVLTVVYVIYVL